MVILMNYEIKDFLNDFIENCSKAQIKTFSKGETITSYIAKRNQFCIIISGSADLIRYNLNGSQTIVEHFSPSDIFGEMFYTITTNNELFVVAKEPSKVLFYAHDDLDKKCKNNCKFHLTLSEMLPKLILEKIITLNSRIELLTKKTIREKLLSYFSILSNKYLTKTITLPFSLTDLADYLNVDRSAMMREIKYLKEDGLIKKNRNKITLLY